MHEMTTAASHAPQQLTALRQELTISDLKHRHDLIQQAIRDVMVPGHHYGEIPGTDGKVSLLKSGAEKLCALFMFAPSFSVVERDLANNHREFRVMCTLTHIPSAVVVAQADGSCSTMESKYRWRLASRKCPDCQSDAIRKSKDGSGGFFCWSKLGGCGATFQEGDRRIISQTLGRVENPDIADQYNTCLKMAAKRSLVAAVLLGTAASDMFITDEDEDDEEPSRPPKRQAKATEAPPKLTAKQELARDCAKMVSELGWKVDEVAFALRENAIAEKFEKWSDLDEATLARAKKMFEAALKAGTPAGGS